MTAPELAGLIRDIVITAFALVGTLALLVFLVLAWVTYRKITPVLESARRISKNIEETTAAVRGLVIGPLLKGGGLGYTVGRVVSFLWGLRGKKGGKGDG